MGFQEGLAEAVDASLDEFGTTGIYRVGGTGSGTPISLESHPTENDPSQDIEERLIEKHHGIYWRVRVKTEVKARMKIPAQVADLQILKFKVSDIPAVLPKDTITIGSTEWTVI